MIQFYGSTNSILTNDLRLHLEGSALRDANLEIHIDCACKAKKGYNSVLILEEPPSVQPRIYRNSNIRKFDLVIHLSPWRSEKYCSQYEVFQPITLPARIINPEKKQKCPIMILDYKFSAEKSSLYGLRRNLLRYFMVNDIPCDLYGTNWNISLTREFRRRWAALRKSLPKLSYQGLEEVFSGLGRHYSNYRGWVEDKYLKTSEYPLAIVIENDIDSLSEKFFDCIFSGTVPLYVGPDLSKFTDLAPLCFQAEPDINSIIDLFSGITQKKIQEKEEAISSYLDCVDLNATFSPSAVSQRISQIIISEFV